MNANIELKKGYIHIYTGNGKGKTTAALGLALRAAGNGLKTFGIRFMQNYPYSELRSVQCLNRWITLRQCGDDAFVLQKHPPDVRDLEAAQEGLKVAREAMLSGEYSLVILDEVCVAIYFKLLKTEELLSFMSQKPEKVELVLTGRYCPQELIEKADLVTEMREIKHYYQKGIIARKGIEC